MAARPANPLIFALDVPTLGAAQLDVAPVAKPQLHGSLREHAVAQYQHPVALEERRGGDAKHVHAHLERYLYVRRGPWQELHRKRRIVELYLDLVVGPLLPVLVARGARCGAIDVERAQVVVELAELVLRTLREGGACPKRKKAPNHGRRN